MPTTFDHADPFAVLYTPRPNQQVQPYRPYQHPQQSQQDEIVNRYQQALRTQLSQHTPQHDQRVTYQQLYSIDPRLQYPNALVYDFPAAPPSRQLGTIGYQLALRNRLAADDLSGHYDIVQWPPIFLHGVLTLPGSLAAVLDKESETAIISRMTPGYIPGWQVVVDGDIREAHLLQVTDPGSRALGMILFGQGSRARALIRKHYFLAKTTTLEATFEVVCGVPRAVRGLTEPRRVFQKTQVRVHAFMLNQKHLLGDLPPVMRGWRMEGFLAGEYV